MGYIIYILLTQGGKNILKYLIIYVCWHENLSRIRILLKCTETKNWRMNLLGKKWPVVNNKLAWSNIMNMAKYLFTVIFTLEKLKFGLKLMLKKVIYKCKLDDTKLGYKNWKLYTVLLHLILKLN